MKNILEVQFFTIPETAELMTVHSDTVKKWIRKEKIKAVRIGRERHISEQQIRDYLNIKNPNQNEKVLL